MLDVVPNVARVYRRVLVVGIDFSRGTDGKADSSVFIDKAAHMVSFLRPARTTDGGDIKIHLCAFAIKENCVVLARIIPRRSATGFVAPDDFVHEVLFAENLVQHQPELRAHAIVDVQIQRAALAEQLPRAGKDDPHPVEVSGFLHRVRIGRQRQLRMPRAYLAVKHVACSKWRIQIDHLYTTSIGVKQVVQRIFRARKNEFARAAVCVPL